MSVISDPAPRPRLMSGVRKFGRYEDFRQFDNLSSGIASVGSKSFGKVTVDCRLLFQKSQWGVLGDQDVPAGVIYLNLNFGPPAGCRIKSATITVTLDDEHPSLRPYKAGRKLHESGYPVQVTDWYGPKQLAGQSKSADMRRIHKLTPEVNILGNGAGGMGVQTEKTFTRVARWSFNGQLLAGKNTWIYKSLKWDLSENELETQSFHNNEVHTAFAFAHAGQPFLMRIEIVGKLERWNDRVKSKLKFGLGSEKDGKVATLIDFVEYKRFQRRLDKLARGLQRDMELENYEEIPVEVPDIIPAFNVWPNPTQSVLQTTSGNVHQILDRGSQSFPLINNSAEATPLESIDQTQNPSDQQQQHYLTNKETTLTIENVQRLLAAFSRPEIQGIDEDEQDSSFNSARTLVEDEDGTGSISRDQSKGINSDKSVTVQQAMDQETIVQLLKIPAILTILQFLASLMNLLGASQRQGAEKPSLTRQSLNSPSDRRETVADLRARVESD